jgi:hypothetical protein
MSDLKRDASYILYYIFLFRNIYFPFANTLNDILILIRTKKLLLLLYFLGGDSNGFINLSSSFNYFIQTVSRMLAP